MVLFLFNIVVDVGFSQTDATVVEAVGNVSLIVSVAGQLDSEVSVSVQVISQDGTAIGELQLAGQYSFVGVLQTILSFFLQLGVTTLQSAAPSL